MIWGHATEKCSRQDGRRGLGSRRAVNLDPRYCLAGSLHGFCATGSVRSENSMRPSGGDLVDQPSEPVASTDVSHAGVHRLRRRRCQLRGTCIGCWDPLGQSLVGAMAVVVPGVAPRDALEMPGADDKQMIEALGSDGPSVGFGQAAISRAGWSARSVRKLDVPITQRVFGPTSRGG